LNGKRCLKYWVAKASIGSSIGLVAYTVAATLWLLFATAVGIVLAYKFGAPDFARGEF